MQINAIILAGGLSSRFGSCKTELKIDDKSILDNTYKLLSRHCSKVMISCKAQKIIDGYPCVYDNFPFHAPIAGIYTSLEYFNGPVLVLSCDLPFIDDHVLETLITARNRAIQNHQNLQMTTYKNKHTSFIEALVAIYEKEALFPLRKAIDSENYSLSKAILEENRHHIIMEDKKPFFNINFQRDLEEAKKVVLQKK